MRPAMIVLGLAVLILVGVRDHRDRHLAVAPAGQDLERTERGGPGRTLRATVAAGLLSPIIISGEPPNNILNAVSVPVGSVRLCAPEQRGGVRASTTPR